MSKLIGWSIGGVIALGIVGLIVYFVLFTSPSDPSSEALKAGFKEHATFHGDLAGVVGAKPDQAGNAADDYVKALQLCEENRDRLEAIQEKREDVWEDKKRLDSAEMNLLKKVSEHVIAGARKEKMQFTFVHTPKRFELQPFSNEDRPDRRFSELSWMLNTCAAEHKAATEYDKAEKVLFAELVLGWHLVEERALPYRVQTGVQIQHDAYEGLYRLYSAWDDLKFKERNPVLNKYVDELEMFQATEDGKLRAFFEKATPVPGSIYYAAENAVERQWRVHAILTMGILRHLVDERDRGNTRYYRKLLEEFAASDDEFERAAAEAAKALPAEAQHVYSMSQWTDVWEKP